MQELH